jgi:hypothetical protein
MDRFHRVAEGFKRSKGSSAAEESASPTRRRNRMKREDRGNTERMVNGVRQMGFLLQTHVAIGRRKRQAL